MTKFPELNDNFMEQARLRREIASYDAQLKAIREKICALQWKLKDLEEYADIYMREHTQKIYVPSHKKGKRTKKDEVGQTITLVSLLDAEQRRKLLEELLGAMQ